MPPVGFKPTISAGEWPQTYALDRAANGTCKILLLLLLKCKAIPLQTWIGPDGSRKLSFPDIITTAQDGGKVVSLTHRPPLPPGNISGTHFC